MKTQDGSLIVVGGASRSGKTAYVRQRVVKARRVIAWDPEDQWAALPGWRRVTTRAELLTICQAAGPVRAGFVAGGDLAAAFDYWAGCVTYAGRYVGPLVAIAEELADVTTPAKAPGKWGILIRRGLKRGIDLFAISQRWQEADKTAIGNASECVFFRQVGSEAGRYLSRMTGCDPAQIPTMPLEYLHFDPRTGAHRRDRLRF